MNGTPLNGLLSTPLEIPASVAGALVALFVVLLLLSLKRAGPGMARLMMGFVALAVFAAAVMVLIDRMGSAQRAAERRAILARNIELTAGSLTPGSMLSCLDAGAGEVIENSCEQAVFASPGSAAGAVAYIGARLSLLSDAAALAQDRDPALPNAFSEVRRSIELDRYGIAAHVLAERDGCTAERCPAFAFLRDTAALKANLRVRAFATYVARYADAWNKAETKNQPASVPMAERPTATLPPVASSAEKAPAKGPMASKYDFPSAASIPPVSIMNSEPLLPKDAAPATGENSAPTAKLPVPPKHPQRQAAEPPAR
jgi:hypothetical protein